MPFQCPECAGHGIVGIKNDPDIGSVPYGKSIECPVCKGKGQLSLLERLSYEIDYEIENRKNQARDKKV